jgi:hypothetical protein
MGRLGTVGNSSNRITASGFLANVANDDVRFSGAAPRLALTRLGHFLDRFPPPRMHFSTFWGAAHARFDIFAILGYLESIKICWSSRAQFCWLRWHPV